MFIGTLPPVSNRAGFSHPIEVVDDDTDELVDLTGCTIVYEIFDPGCDRTVLSATTGNSKVSITATGAFQVDFTASEMRGLSAKTYQVGCTISNDDSEPQQFIIGNLPVLSGVVA